MHEALHPHTDPYMTRTARAARTAWRLEHLTEWNNELETLFYYDPEYAYDVVHEHEDEWTTDPDHAGNGIKFYEFDEGSVLEPTDDRRTLLEGTMLTILRTVLGNHAESQGRLYFPGNITERLKLLTRGGNRGSYVKPDLMVFPSVYALPTGVHRDRSDCAPRTYEGDPPPELVVEILSVSSVVRDYGVKACLYMALGVAEYWVCDVGDIRGPDSPVELSVFRLGADGLYAPVSPSQPPAAAGRDGPHSESVAGAGRVAVPAANPGREQRRRLPVRPWLCPQAKCRPVKYGGCGFVVPLWNAVVCLWVAVPLVPFTVGGGNTPAWRPSQRLRIGTSST